MTNKRLKQFSQLTNDIARRKAQIESLKSLAEGTTTRITGLPGSRSVTDKVGNAASELVILRAELEVLLMQSQDEYVEITRFIEEQEDALLRQILQFKHIDGLPWEQVGALIGMSGESCRKAQWRLLTGKH